MPNNPLELRDLGHSYSGPSVFEGVSLTVAPGELVSILGASGSGKSTLLRAAAGFVTPTRGSVWIGGEEVAREGRELIPAERRGVGMMFQDYALFPHMNVAENVAFGLPGDPHGAARVSEVLALVDLQGLEDRRPGALSGGQQQRVALARALAPRPSLLLLDEPFANLDGPLRFEVGSHVVEILASEGVGALLVTHDREEALGLSHRVAVLASTGDEPAGLLQVGSPQEVYDAPVSAAAALLTGRVSFLSTGSNERLAIRPEEASFQPDESGEDRVLSRRYTGACWELRVETEAGTLLVDHVGASAPQTGTAGTLMLATDRTVPGE
jgi:iron(III) transport system ATP-binding protein